MIKRFLIVVVVLAILIAVATLVYSLFFVSEETPERKVVEPKAAAWNGKETKYVGSSFVGQRNRLDIIGYEFSKLNTPNASVLAVLNTQAVGGRVPAWVKQKRGFVGNIGAKRLYPKVRYVSKGTIYKITLSFPKVPIKALGISCQGELPTPFGAPQYPLYINFNSFARNPRNVLSAAVLAPEAPAGHCLGKGAKAKPKPKVRINRIKVIGKKKKRKVWVSGTARNLKKVRVSIGKAKRFARVRKNKRFVVVFKAPSTGRKKKKVVVIRAGNNKRPSLAVKRVVIRKK